MALIKTQGSDTKLVGQMQPCYVAMTLGRQNRGSHHVPSLVAQIADGENGGVMMNEFPAAFAQAHRRLVAGDQSHSGTVAINGSEYLDLLEAAGVSTNDFPAIQAVQQHKLWAQLPESFTPEATDAAIAQLQTNDPSFLMAGASWTNNLSWVEGYANVLEPMQQLSADFHRLFDPMIAADPAITTTEGYQCSLLHVLLLETSCFRY